MAQVSDGDGGFCQIRSHLMNGCLALLFISYIGTMMRYISIEVIGIANVLYINLVVHSSGTVWS